MLRAHRARHRASREGRKIPRALECTRNSTTRTEDSHAATQKSRARTQNKVLVIMDYEIFQKQAYQRTGSQRDSISKETDSIQRGMNNSSPVFDSSNTIESAATSLPIPLC